MKKILIFIVAIAIGVGNANAAVRDGNTASRGGGATSSATQKRVATTTKSERTTTPRVTVLGTQSRLSPVVTTPSRGTTTRTPATDQNTQKTKSVTARATTDTISASETRTGAEYEACKTAFFSCMDQFCSLKNDDYRRCSCSDRVDSLADSREVLTQAGEQLTVFTENLDVVGMTAAQATAMRTASEGENALTSDTSASKALLQAIMNSIRGGDTNVGGKYSNLNSIDLSFDTAMVFGNDASQLVSMYNGQSLYSAVYPQCREAVRNDCNNASLQRAITAYLMAIEQDCNTVQTAIEQKQKELKSAIREGSALLDLARVENRQKHNTDDITTCINNVENAILSEEVCGYNYHKCLDNGEFIDISTGAPITGVKDFYKLGTLLTFEVGVEGANQRLSKRTQNKSFVSGFEKRTKKFAKPALDKCVEIADEVWSEYLDKAMLAIYYAQQSKVSQIQQGCFDFVTQCYESSNAAITAAMAQLTGDATVILQPNRLVLSQQMCTDYVESCNNMFDGNIIETYVEQRQDEDVLAACRAVVKQCFDKYGGNGYENFYYPYSGLFSTGLAPDWFALYDTDGTTLKSPCAQQLASISSCADFVEEAFGGLDAVLVSPSASNASIFVQDDANGTKQYGLRQTTNGTTYLRHRELRAVGVATEIYNQIIDTLSTRCMNINGRFMPVEMMPGTVHMPTNYCQWQSPTTNNSYYTDLIAAYGFNQTTPENICPRDYALSVDTQSWGACSCWDNGGRRSRNGRTATCVAELPTGTLTPEQGAVCSIELDFNVGVPETVNNWCTQKAIDYKNRVCPAGFYALDPQSEDQLKCIDATSTDSTNTTYPDAFFDALVPTGE